MAQYEDVAAARFTVVAHGVGETIRITAHRTMFVSLFLAFWLCAWSAAGYFVVTQFLDGNGNLFLLFWLAMWALGWLGAAGSLAWLVAGAEEIRVGNSDLEINHKIFGFSRRKLYRGSEIAGMTATSGVVADGWSSSRDVRPKSALKFTYGVRSVYAAAGLDEAEGALIVDRLRRRLPSSAFAK